jgi:hypothetical protein
MCTRCFPGTSRRARTTVAAALLGILVEVDCVAQLKESG